MTTRKKINELRTASINFLISRMLYRGRCKELNGCSVLYSDVGGSGYFLEDNMDSLQGTASTLAMSGQYRSEETPENIVASDAMPLTLIYDEPTGTSDSGLSLSVYDTFSKKYGYVRLDDLCVENIDLVLSHFL